MVARTAQEPLWVIDVELAGSVDYNAAGFAKWLIHDKQFRAEAEATSTSPGSIRTATRVHAWTADDASARARGALDQLIAGGAWSVVRWQVSAADASTT